MPEIFNKRMTTSNEDNLVVFLIGMRINKFWQVNQWRLLATAMPKMLKELYQNPNLGFLSHEMWFSRTIILVQYWRSIEQLNEYAKNKNSEHLPAWKAFNKKMLLMMMLAFGIKRHETYQVNAGQYETIYNNMPLFGLAKAKAAIDIDASTETADQRLTKTTIHE